MIFETFSVALSIETIIILLLVGAAIKHLKLFDKISNDLIPVALFVLSFIITIFTSWPLTHDNILNVIMISLASAIVAVGIHSSGKNVFANGQFVNLFMKKYEEFDIPIDNINIENVDENRTNRVSDTEPVSENVEEKKEE